MNLYLRHKICPNGFLSQLSNKLIFDPKSVYIQAVGLTDRGIKFILLLTLTREFISYNNIKLDDYIPTIVRNFREEDVIV